MPVLSLACAIIAAPTTPILVREYLTLGRVGAGGRVPVVSDEVEARLADGSWRPPAAGEQVRGQTWQAATADQNGTILSPSWAYAKVNAPSDGVWLMQAVGTSIVYLNGLPFGTDVYAYGWMTTPVRLNKGENELLVRVGRGRLKVEFRQPTAAAGVLSADHTLPDVVSGERGDLLGSALLWNASEKTVRLAISSSTSGGTRRGEMVSIPPLGTLRAPFAIARPAPAADSKTPLRLRAVDERGQPVGDFTDLELTFKGPRDVHRRTFLSQIDGSVQYYGVQPAQAPNPTSLILSLHGASVEGIGQAAAYGGKTWATFAAPTNRRPFGFDWEDWGRQDALEVLAEAQKRFAHDPAQVYLTGHSMGGHGTWSLGSLFPGKFAAIGPAAGWINFWSYGGAVRYDNPGPVERMLLRAAQVSDPLLVKENYLSTGVFILHGDADETVPVTQAREMRQRLQDMKHPSLAWFEQPGGGHWYDTTPAPGADCVDYDPMFQFMARHRLKTPKQTVSIDFATCSPGITSQHSWAQIWNQATPADPSRIQIQQISGLRRIQGKTTNVQRLRLDLASLWEPGPVTLSLDTADQREVAWPKDGILWLERRGMSWSVSEAPSLAEKHPGREGWFRNAFGNRFVLVYGTSGTPEENAWTLAKARHDALVWWYRGNGRADVVADRDLDLAKTKDRSLILFGHADCNAAFARLLPNSPAMVRRGSIQVGDRKVDGQDLAILLLQPRNDSQVAHVGVVGGTGISGMRAAHSLPYFVSGVHYPDLFIARSSILREGVAGVQAAGWLGRGWGLAGSEIAWRE